MIYKQNPRKEVVNKKKKNKKKLKLKTEIVFMRKTINGRVIEEKQKNAIKKESTSSNNSTRSQYSILTVSLSRK